MPQWSGVSSSALPSGVTLRNLLNLSVLLSYFKMETMVPCGVTEGFNQLIHVQFLV